MLIGETMNKKGIAIGRLILSAKNYYVKELSFSSQRDISQIQH
jgi:hypothetical protein